MAIFRFYVWEYNNTSIQQGKYKIVVLRFIFYCAQNFVKWLLLKMIRDNCRDNKLWKDFIYSYLALKYKNIKLDEIIFCFILNIL